MNLDLITSIRRRIASSLVVLLALVGAGAATAQRAQAPQEPLTIGLIATATVEQTLAAWKPVTDAMARKLNRPVQVVASTNYADIANGMKEDRIQIAWVSSRLAVELVESRKAVVFAQMVKLDGSLGYKSLLLVPKASPIVSIDHLVAHPGAYRFASGDAKSMSGFLVPNYYVFRKYRIDPQRHFSVLTRGSHRDNFLAVAEGRADLATSNTEDLPRFRDDLPEKYAGVRVLWESPLIANDPILYRNDLSAPVQQSIKQFFIGYGRTAEEKAVLASVNGLSGFKSSGNYQLRPVVDLEMFEVLTRAMREQIASPEAFALVREQITQRAARLDSLMNSTRLER